MQSRAALASLLAVPFALGLAAACESRPPVSDPSVNDDGTGGDGGTAGVGSAWSSGCYCRVQVAALTIDLRCGEAVCSSFGNQLCVDAGHTIPIDECAEPDGGADGGLDSGVDGGRTVPR